MDACKIFGRGRLEAAQKVWVDMDYLKRLPLFLGLMTLALCAAVVMWLQEAYERWYWKRFARLKMGASDGHHVMVGGRCRTL